MKIATTRRQEKWNPFTSNWTTDENETADENTRSSAIAEKATRTVLSGTMAIQDVQIVAVHLFSICFNEFARWHQRSWFKWWKIWGDRVGV